MSDPMISIVVPVRNEERFIEGTLERLRQQAYPHSRLEILVCDGRSDDRTREIVSRIAAEDPRVRLLDNPGRRSSSGRNVGFRAASGDVMLVVDGHVEIPDDRLLRAVADLLERSGASCLGRPQPLIPEPGSAWSSAIAEARASPLGHAADSLIYSGYEGPAAAASIGAAYTPEVFRRVGYVDESFDACEDLEFNTRIDKAGLVCFTSPSLTVRYYARTSPGGLFRQLYRYGFGRLKYLRRHPDRISVGQLLPPLLVIGLLALPPLAVIDLRLAAPFAAGAAVWLAAILIAAVALALRHGVRRLPRYLVVLPIIHLAVGAGFLASAVRGGRLRRAGPPDEATA